MDRIEIYNDKHTKIEIDKAFHDYIEKMIIKTIKIPPSQYTFLFEYALDKLIENKIDYKGCSFKSSSSAPVLEYYKFLSLIEPFDIFDFAMSVIIIQENQDNFDEIVEIIKNYYKEKDIIFYMEFFDKPIYKINGFMSAIVDNQLLISFFSLGCENENIEDSN